MKIDLIQSCPSELRTLRCHIVNGIRSTGVKDVETLVMKALADAIVAEHRRSNVIDGDLSDYNLTASVNFKIRICRRGPASTPPKKRELSSLLAELDDAVASQAGDDVVERSV